MLEVQSKVFCWQASLRILVKVVHFCFRFASFRKVCIEMPGVLEWFMWLTLFGCLQHSTVSQLSSSVFRFSFSGFSSPPFHLSCSQK